MRVLDASFGHLVLLMPEEQKNKDVIEAIEKLKEIGRVVICISGCDCVEEVICKLIKSSTWNV